MRVAVQLADYVGGSEQRRRLVETDVYIDVGICVLEFHQGNASVADHDNAVSNSAPSNRLAMNTLRLDLHSQQSLGTSCFRSRSPSDPNRCWEGI